MSGNYNRQDRLYKQAKEEGFRSRAAYKLIEINKKYGILKHGFKILDLGAWPGGWTQVAAQAVGDGGLVVAIDLVMLDELPESNVKILQGDARDDKNIAALKDLAAGKYNTVLSDMSPKLTGIKECDQAGTVACAELALYVASQVLEEKGNLVIKVFKGNDTEVFFKTLRKSFTRVVRAELDSTRKTSNEFYLIGLEYKPEPVQD